MLRPSILKTLATLSLALTLSALAGCGGSDGRDDPGTNDVAQAYTVSPTQSQPIVHTFAKPGSYTLTLTGQYAPSSAAQADTLQTWFSFSGQGVITSGSGEPSVVVPVNAKTIQIAQTVGVTLTGAGPWQIVVLTSTTLASGTVTDLTLNTSTR